MQIKIAKLFHRVMLNNTYGSVVSPNVIYIDYLTYVISQRLLHIFSFAGPHKVVLYIVPPTLANW